MSLNSISAASIVDPAIEIKDHSVVCIFEPMFRIFSSPFYTELVSVKLE